LKAESNILSDKTIMGIGPLLLVTAELALAMLVVVLFQLEPSKLIGRGLFCLVPVFVAHSLLPLKFRLPLLLAATAALLFYLLGVTAAAITIGAGLLLIGLCHLPLAFRSRLLLVLVVATVFALLQGRVFHASRHLMLAMPVLGALFMFRLLIYMYDIRHENPGAATIWQRLSYFFLLPAPLFPFFPVLDYRMFLRCYYARPAFEISQTGILWMSRGIIHLVLYRFIYHFYSPAAEYVVDLGGVMAFCLSGYLIYLRVSGLFHLIAGSLRLFGFDLPDTHRLYFFASGFSDYWKRINIYWKDFMAKLFFFPSFGMLKKLETRARVAAATAIVFVATTYLHSYQMFWLQGRFTIYETDYWFWGILGVLVILNQLYDDKNRSQRKLPGAKLVWDFKVALKLSVQTTAMFVFLCLLWSLWSSQELSVWIGVMKQAANMSAGDLALFFGFCGAAVFLGVLGQYVRYRGFTIFEEHPKIPRSVATTVIPLAVCAVVWVYHAKLGLPGVLGEKFDVVRIDQPNERDQNAKERSYYEGLLAAPQSDAESSVELKDSGANDIRQRLYRANLRNVEAWGAKWSTNAWGMHDKPYSKKKSAGKARIAMSGASYAVGRGVSDGKNFESVLEGQLKDVEILNFAMADTSTIQRMADLDLRIRAFDPDYFMIVVHGNEMSRTIRKLASQIAGGDELTYPWLKNLVKGLGVSPETEEADIIRALNPKSKEIMEWTYGRIAAICKEEGIKPLWVFLPLVRAQNQLLLAEETGVIARAAGIETIVLDNAYGAHSPEELRVSEQDYHPNELGHRMIAKRLGEKLKESILTRKDN
jgi:hypothetical protein